MMWNIMCKRKIHSKRLIHLKNHKKAWICKLLKDKGLFGIVSMAKLFNQDIIFEFYANLKSNILNVCAP